MDILDKGISIVLHCRGTLLTDRSMTVDAYLPESVAATVLSTSTPLLEAFIRDIAVLHLANLRDRHDLASLPVPNDLNLDTTPARYQFGCAISDDGFHLTLDTSHVCLSLPFFSQSVS